MTLRVVTVCRRGRRSVRRYLRPALKTLVNGVQDGVLDDVPVDLLSRPERRQLGDDRGQTQGGVVCQRHVTYLQREDRSVRW